MATAKKKGGFSEQEKAAMKERAAELKAQARGADGEADLLAKVGEMPDDERVLATKFHELVKEVAPDLTSRTWYGMPAYARDGKVLCFFQSGAKMKTRYCTVGFSDQARLDEGSLWPTSFALTTWNATNAQTLRALVTRAVG